MAALPCPLCDFWIDRPCLRSQKNPNPLTHARWPNNLLGHLEHLRETKDLLGNLARSIQTSPAMPPHRNPAVFPVRHADVEAVPFQGRAFCCFYSCRRPTMRLLVCGN